MKLAKAQIDFGLCTNNIDALLSFWQTDVGLQLDLFCQFAADRRSTGMTP